MITDANVWSAGNDTLSLWRTSDGMFSEDAAAHTSPNGRYYHARLDVWWARSTSSAPAAGATWSIPQIHEMN